MNKALTTLQKALAHRPERWETRRLLVEMLLDQGDPSEALRLIAEAPTPADPTWLAGITPRLASVQSAVASVADGTQPGVLKGKVRSAEELKAFEEKVVRERAEKAALMQAEAERLAEIEATKARKRAELMEALAARERGEDWQTKVRSLQSAAEQNVVLSAESDQPSLPIPEPVDLVVPPLLPTTNRTVEAMLRHDKHVAYAIAVGVHLVALFLLGLAVRQMTKPAEPDIVVSTSVAPIADSLMQNQLALPTGLVSALPQYSTGAAGDVLTAAGTGLAGLPVPQFSSQGGLGASDTLGEGLGLSGFGSGGGSGSISFFGGKATGKRVAFVVDFSASMSSADGSAAPRIQLLKQELTRSIQAAIGPRQQFTVIYFSGPSWTLGMQPRSGALGRDRDQLPSVRWVPGTPQAKRAAIDEIRKMDMADGAAGTFWVPALKSALALDPKPDLVFFFTDGDAQDHSDIQPVLDDFKRHNIKLFTSAMGNPGAYGKILAEMADKHRGSYSVVLDGKTYVGPAARRLGKGEIP